LVLTKHGADHQRQAKKASKNFHEIGRKTCEFSFESNNQPVSERQLFSILCVILAARSVLWEAGWNLV